MTVYYSVSGASITVSSGGTGMGYAVSGVGTQWNDFVQPGDTLSATLSSGGSASGVDYTIAAVLGSTSLTLSNSTGATGTGTEWSIALLSFGPPAALAVPAVSALVDLSCDANDTLIATAPGYASVGDGGGGSFYWDGSAISSVSALLLVSAGLGYTTSGSSTAALTLTPTDGGTGATGTATIRGYVTSVSLSADGSGFTETPSVSIASPSIASSRVAAATAVMQVASISIIDGGSNYTASATATIEPPGYAGDTAEAGAITRTSSAGTSGIITAIAVTSGGTLYSSAPSVTISDASGTGAVASATLSLLAVEVTDMGYNYSTSSGEAPAVTISGGGGAGASGSAIVEGMVSDVTLGSGGSGYASAPSVTLSGAGTPTSSATFQAVIAADGGTAIFPNATTSGAWRRIID